MCSSFDSRGVLVCSPCERLARILQIRVLLVIEIVQQRDNAPHVFVLAEHARITTDRGLDRERVLSKAFALGVLGQLGPRIFTRQLEHHSVGLAARCDNSATSSATT